MQIPFLLHSISSQIFNHMKLEELLCKDGIDHRRMWQVFNRERDPKWKELQKQDGRGKKQEDYFNYTDFLKNLSLKFKLISSLKEWVEVS